MRFLRRGKHPIKKTILVISDIHLGAGAIIKGQRNYLEDFHYDEEMVDFLEFYSKGEYKEREVELVINGDFFDHLAVPFVPFFDDEYWSEPAALAKLEMILKAHREVMSALAEFASGKKKTIVYIIGNHDAEMVFESLQKRFLECFAEEDREKVRIITDNSVEYSPVDGVAIKHGHEYEIAHQYDPKASVFEDRHGISHFIPPWGSYYVIRVINKFKEERGHINAVRPIKKFIINGLIYDTLFTLRFVFQTCYYFIMVRFNYLFRQNSSIRNAISYAVKELHLFQDYEEITQEMLHKRDDLKALIVGHTHEPIFRSNADGKVFINTGTWTNMYHLDFARGHESKLLTYAQIDVKEKVKVDAPKFANLELALNVWEGVNKLPFEEYRSN